MNKLQNIKIFISFFVRKKTKKSFPQKMFNFNVDKKLKRWKNCDIISNMKNIFTKYGFNLTEKQLSQFEKYYNLLIDFNAKFNLTAITEKEEVYIKHFVDSIMAVKMLNCGKLIDVGSGGGFPAIPIKIMCEI